MKKEILFIKKNYIIKSDNYFKIKFMLLIFILLFKITLEEEICSHNNYCKSCIAEILPESIIHVIIIICYVMKMLFSGQLV